MQQAAKANILADWCEPKATPDKPRKQEKQMTRPYGYYPRRRKPSTETPPPSRQDVAVDEEPLNMSRVSLNSRLVLADKFVMAHPGRPISAMLLELFPELNLLRKTASLD